MPYTFNNQDFCKRWKATANPKDYQYCRRCISEPCEKLWAIVKKLASDNNYQGTKAKTSSKGKLFRLYTTPRQAIDSCFFQSLEPKRKGTPWNIPKEDFMYVLKTGDDKTPSDTRQKSHVEPIIELIATRCGRSVINRVLEM